MEERIMSTHAAAPAKAPTANAERGAEVVTYTIATSSLGGALVARREAGLAAVLLDDDADALRAELRAHFPRATLVEDDAAMREVAAAVVAAIDTPARAFDGSLDIPLDPAGTEFQCRVWRALAEIPTGTTTTYAALADRLGMPKSARAVAGACASNPIAVLVPCHRVVRGDGGLAGYRWGLARKRALLARESA
jgi:AraC family transcriptional regulator of adaptative response/methylated-DNA-[protein]-cysteine methyltransferase